MKLIFIINLINFLITILLVMSNQSKGEQKKKLFTNTALFFKDNNLLFHILNYSIHVH